MIFVLVLVLVLVPVMVLVGKSMLDFPTSGQPARAGRKPRPEFPTYRPAATSSLPGATGSGSCAGPGSCVGSGSGAGSRCGTGFSSGSTVQTRFGLPILVMLNLS